MIRGKAILILICLIILAAATCLSAQQEDPAASSSKPDYEHLLERMKKEFKENKENFQLMPAGPPTHMQDTEVMAAYRRAWKGYYAYLAEGLDYRMKVFHWQARSTVIIFYTVLLLVFAGILFSGIQFYKSLRMPKESGLQADQPLTEFEASTSGIKVSSPVLGVIILVISLAFFYLYLVYVYPIQETF